MRVLRSAVRTHTRLVVVLVAVGVAVGWVVLRPQPVAAAPTDLAAATLLSADTTPALFDAALLSPGRPQVRCLDVALPSPPATTSVLLRATSVSGPLAQDMQVVVETGPATGAPAGSCTGFAGTEVYRGTLAELAAISDSAPYGVATGWTLTTGHRTQSFRITTSVPDVSALQGRTAVADLVWASIDVPAPPTSPPATARATDAPTSTPTAEPTGTPTAEPRPTAAPTHLPTDDPTEAVVPGGGDGDAGGWSPLRDLLAVGERVTRTVVGTVQQSGFPAALLGVIGVFLAVQNTLDRRDPKLALAPLDDDEDLPFDTGVVR